MNPRIPAKPNKTRKKTRSRLRCQLAYSLVRSFPSSGLGTHTPEALLPGPCIRPKHAISPRSRRASLPVPAGCRSRASGTFVPKLELGNERLKPWLAPKRLIQVCIFPFYVVLLWQRFLSFSNALFAVIVNSTAFKTAHSESQKCGLDMGMRNLTVC